MDRTKLRGVHNAENLMAALAVGYLMGLSFEAMAEPLSTYAALPHRCELVRTFDEVDYVNDSKATNIDALEKALVSETRPVVLIAGGKDKGFEFDSITDLVAKKVHRRGAHRRDGRSASPRPGRAACRARRPIRSRTPSAARAAMRSLATWSFFLPVLLPSTCSKATPIAATNSATSVQSLA